MLPLFPRECNPGFAAEALACIATLFAAQQRVVLSDRRRAPYPSGQ
jgi:hypothetical protein